MTAFVSLQRKSAKVLIKLNTKHMNLFKISGLYDVNIKYSNWSKLGFKNVHNLLLPETPCTIHRGVNLSFTIPRKFYLVNKLKAI